MIWIAFDLLRAANDGYFKFSLFYSAILFGIVLLHEYGHCFAGRAVGGHADRILLWPLGGLAYVQAAYQPLKQFIVAAGGPAVNVAIAIFLLPYLIWGDGVFGSYFLNIGLSGAYAGDWLSILFAINFDLFIFNLIPAFPMDGGRILRCMLWPKMGLRRATTVTMYVAWVAAGLMFIAGLWVFATQPGARGLMLPMIALLSIFGSWQEKKMVDAGYMQEERGGGEDWGVSTYQPEAPRKPSWFARAKERREARRQEKEARERMETNRHVDELLEKVSREGITSLTAREKRFLKNAGRKYKSRS